MIDSATPDYAGADAGSTELLHGRLGCSIVVFRRLESTDKHGRRFFSTIVCGRACIKWWIRAAEEVTGARDKCESFDIGGLRRTHARAGVEE